ncbi:MAG: HAMP domain-containing sensor histidine kinase [Nitrospirota bacterium]
MSYPKEDLKQIRNTDRKSDNLRRLIHYLETLQLVSELSTSPRSPLDEMCYQIVVSLSRLLQVSYIAVQQIGRESVRVSGIKNGAYFHKVTFLEENNLVRSEIGSDELGRTEESYKRFFPEDGLVSPEDFNFRVNVPLKDSRGEVNGFIYCFDRKDGKLAEDKIQLIEIFAKFLSCEIERDILEAKARESDRTRILSQLAAGIAHEIRNPLNAILVITEAFFQEAGENPEHKPFLDHIKTQVDRLSRLMADLLELGNPTEPNLRRESLPAICRSALNLWNQMSVSQKHEVRAVGLSGNEEMSVLADSFRLQKVFLNLLENAAQHSPAGSEIQFILSKPSETIGQARIVDQGSGVPDESLQKVFEPFFTMRKSRNGLGLSLARQIVQMHSGEIALYNNVSPPGCTVKVSLPLCTEGKW